MLYEVITVALSRLPNLGPGYTMTDELAETRLAAHQELADHIDALAGDHVDRIAMQGDELVLEAPAFSIVPLLMFLSYNFV